MTRTKLALVFILLTLTAMMFAAPITLTFRDTGTTTRTLIWAENDAYPQPTPTDGSYPRWIYRVYKTTDSVIDPLDGEGNPTGDDVLATNFILQGYTANAGFLNIGPTGGVNFNAPSLVCPDPGADPSVIYHSVGQKIYYRIFNAPTMAEATKYIVWAAPYTVLSANLTINMVPTPGWHAGGWVTFKSVTPLISGAILSTLPLNGVTMHCTGQPNYVTTANGLYSFSVPAGTTVTITPSKTGYRFVPPFRTYENVQEAITGADFEMINLSPHAATQPNPANLATLVQPQIGQVSWKYIPLPYYDLPEGFKVYFPDTAPPVVVPYVHGVEDYFFPIPLLAYNTMYPWKVVPFNGAKAANEVADARDKEESKGDATGWVQWSFTTRGALLISDGFPFVIDPDGTVGPIGTFVFNTPLSTEGNPIPVIQFALTSLGAVPPFTMQGAVLNGWAANLTANGGTPLSVDVPAGIWYGMAYYNGMWNEGTLFPTAGPGTITWDYIIFPAKGTVPVMFLENIDPWLPVELSSFTATFAAGFFVNLTWVVQSETNHLGYYVLRNNVDHLGSAVALNTTPIASGTTSGTQITYNYRDEEIESNNIYYYWLESVDLDGTARFFGPVSVTVTGGNPEEPTPIIPTVTALLNAYPNPFNPRTTIPYSIKDAGEVKIEIYNIKGQLIHSFTENHSKAGYYKAVWEGRDNNGKQVSSGVYYYRMTSGKYSASKKIVLVK